MIILKAIEKVIVYINIALAAVSLAAMIAVGLAQVILRNLLNSGLSWGDVVFRMLALWVGFAGAVVAASRGRHIAIGVLAQLVPVRLKMVAHLIVSIFTSTVCLFLTHSAIRFVLSEKDAGGVLIGGIPLWISELIVPTAFSCIMYLFFVHAFSPPADSGGG